MIGTWILRILIKKIIMEQTRNEKLQFLHKAMIRYENMVGTEMKQLKKDLYERNKIESRKELTDAQLEAEIIFFTSV